MIKVLLLFLCTINVLNAEVVKLDSTNFKKTLEDSEYLLVKFYAPWCGHCKKMAPAYEQLSNEKLTNVVIAEVDATVESNLASEYDVKGFPTLKWFMNATEYEFRGGRDLDSMKSFIKSAIGEWATIIETKEQMDAFLNIDEDTAVVLSNDLEVDIRPLSTMLSGLSFGHLRGDGVSLLKEGTLRIYNKFDGELKYVEYNDEVSDGVVDRFLRKNSIPYINTLNSKSIKLGFDYSKKHILFFCNEEQLDNVEKQILPVAKTYSPDYIFVTIEHTNKNVVDMFDVKTFPSAFLVDLSGKIKKYPLENDITSENIRNLISDYEDDKLKPKMKSQDEPIQESGKPYVLVGKTFSEVTKSNDVLVKFYAPWCGHCKKLAPIWDELALKMQDEDVKIAKFDATENEHEDVSVQGYPTIKFYKGGNPIDYRGARDLKSLVSFLKEHVSTPLKGSHTEL